MALSNYQGPPNHTEILRHLKGETIKACFVDEAGHIWLVMPSGYAVMFAGFDYQAPAFAVAAPDSVQQAIDRRRVDLQKRIQDVKNLAPGIDL